ncbi:MAG: inverse autotransporter beta domain-containing protein [Legionellales bacterium]|nr:inverse autotransporter beta domain-containing protein [Legionellales bacterium]
MRISINIRNIILTSLIILQLHNTFSYQAKIEIEYKGGNTRQIGRYGILLPVYTNDSNLIFSNIFLMNDSKSTLEGNFGFGYRKNIDSRFIIGGYGFWDIRKITNVTDKIHQITFGLEYMTPNVEIRINGYIPENKNFLVFSGKRIVSNYDGTNNITNHTLSNYQIYQVPLRGFDIEIASYLFIPRISASITYFNFFAKKNVKAIRGARFRSDIKLNQLISFTGEFSSGTNLSHYFLGIKFSFDLTKKRLSNIFNMNILPTKLAYKMHKMAIRDLDIISNDLETTENIYSKNFQNYIPIILNKKNKSILGITDTRGNAIFLNKESEKLIT